MALVIDGKHRTRLFIIELYLFRVPEEEFEVLNLLSRKITKKKGSLPLFSWNYNNLYYSLIRAGPSDFDVRNTVF
jgi:hypothetical protein